MRCSNALVLERREDDSDFCWTSRRGTGSVRRLAHFAMERGMRLERILAGVLDREAFDDPATEITALGELSTIRNITSSLGRDPCLGLAAGSRYHVTAHGTLGLAMLSSATAREALALGLRFVSLSSAFVRLRVEEGDGELRVILDDGHIPEDVRDFITARDAAAMATLRRDLLPAQPSYRRACVRHRAPRDLSLYRELWGGVPEFEAPVNMVAYDARALDVPLPHADRETLRECERECEAALVRKRGPASVAAIVRAKLAEHGEALVDMRAMARCLGTTPRTLHRRLAREDTTYRDVVDGFRTALAQELLRGRRCSLGDIAHRLGYSDVTSFHHAFKRLTGTSPSQYARRVGPTARASR